MCGTSETVAVTMLHSGEDLMSLLPASDINQNLYPILLQTLQTLAVYNNLLNKFPSGVSFQIEHEKEKNYFF